MVTRLAAVALGLVLVVSGLARADEQQRRKWWQDEKVKTEIGLTEGQASNVEAIFQAALPKLRAAKQQLDALEAELSELIREPNEDESLVAAQIDKVETARAELGRTRTLMLYRIHRVLTPEQNTKLRALRDRRTKTSTPDSHRPRF